MAATVGGRAPRRRCGGGGIGGRGSIGAVTGDRSTRIDRYLGTVVHIVGSRQARPNLPSTGCPFCVGGLEAPEPYDVRWFPNRWPAYAPGDPVDTVAAEAVGTAKVP